MEQLQQKAIARVFADRLARIGKDIPAWVDLFVEDAIVEFPDASALGSPEGWEGKAAIYNYIKDVPAQMQNLIFTKVRKYPTSNPNVLFAEVQCRCTVLADTTKSECTQLTKLVLKDSNGWRKRCA
ncbi:hypothetical protein QUA56_33000 [Microcoleus sp. N3A4]